MLDSVSACFIDSDLPIPKPTHIMFSMVASRNSKEQQLTDTSDEEEALRAG